ncbi:TRAP transporter permease [Streptomyces sp. NPDC054841]
MPTPPTVEELVAEYEQERPMRRLSSPVRAVVSAVCAVLSVFALYVVFFPLEEGPQYYVTVFLAVALPLCFLTHRGTVRIPALRLPWRPSGGTAPGAGKSGAEVPGAEVPGAEVPGAGKNAAEKNTAGKKDDPGFVDWALAALAVAAGVYPLIGFQEFHERLQLPTSLDTVSGLLLLLLVLEACRRTTGWVLPAFCVGFLLYAYYGGLLPYDWSLAHGGFDANAILANLSMGADGFYGMPLKVAATYIVLFTVYGTVLDLSGAGAFFINLSLAAFRGSRSAPGRTVTAAGLLMGTVSGSGSATAVSLGSVAWPLLRRAGYSKEKAGGVLAAAGIGAILSPPTLGAAAFVIAEYLKTSYLTVLLYATVPMLLYYLGILLAIEIDARKNLTGTVETEPRSALRLLARFGYHFLSLFLIIGFMAVDLPPFKAVVYATGVQFVLSFLDPAHRLTPRRLYEALAQGSRSALPVVATCAAAGIIVAVVTQTGLGLNLATIIVDFAGAFGSDPTVQLTLTALFAAVSVSVLGLAVPVTASFIISAVIIAPAMTSLGVTAPEAYMFIFYYAVLSEVTPPTALAAAAAAAITGGSPLRTMNETWKYSLPAFLIPFSFVLTDNGTHLLGQGAVADIAWVTAVSALAVAALAAATGGWLLGPSTLLERLLCAASAVLLLYLVPVSLVAGSALLALALGIHTVRRRRPDSGAPCAAVRPRSETSLMKGSPNR